MFIKYFLKERKQDTRILYLNRQILSTMAEQVFSDMKVLGKYSVQAVFLKKLYNRIRFSQLTDHQKNSSKCTGGEQ